MYSTSTTTLDGEHIKCIGIDDICIYKYSIIWVHKGQLFRFCSADMLFLEDVNVMSISIRNRLRFQIEFYPFHSRDEKFTNRSNALMTPSFFEKT